MSHKVGHTFCAGSHLQRLILNILVIRFKTNLDLSKSWGEYFFFPIEQKSKPGPKRNQFLSDSVKASSFIEIHFLQRSPRNGLH